VPVCYNLSNTINVNVQNPATITSYVPNNAAVGATVLINGTNFSTATSVIFNGVSASFTVINSGQISAVVPAGATTGNISVTTICSTINGTSFTVNQPSTQLNLKVYIQGFYLGGGSMVNIIGAGLTDTITVELHQPVFPFALVQSRKGLLAVNGTSTLNFTSAIAGNSYYIVVRHRNAIQTWSKNPVAFSSSTAYNFSVASGPRPAPPDVLNIKTD
jgi:hypothetical protein